MPRGSSDSGAPVTARSSSGPADAASAAPARLSDAVPAVAVPAAAVVAGPAAVASTAVAAVAPLPVEPSASADVPAVEAPRVLAEPSAAASADASLEEVALAATAAAAEASPSAEAVESAAEVLSASAVLAVAAAAEAFASVVASAEAVLDASALAAEAAAAVASLVAAAVASESAFAIAAASAAPIAAALPSAAECSRLVTGVPVPGLLEALDDLRARVRDPEIETSSKERVAVLYAEGLRGFIRGELPLAAAELPLAAAELRAAGEQLTPVVPTPVSALLNLLHTAVYTEPVGGVAPDRRKGLYPIEVLPEGWRGIYGGMFRAIGLEGETPPETAWLRLTARYFDGLYRGELAGLAESLDASERALAYPRTSAMLAHIDATASEDPEALVGAGESLEACNMYASAVFAYEQARAIFQERRLTARVTA